MNSSGGVVLAGFLLSGFLLALLGAILPAWGFHRDPARFAEAGHYFLSLAVGIIVSTRLTGPLLARRGLRFLLAFACLVCCLALVGLALASPPASAWLRVAGLLVLGVGAGLFNLGLFHALSAAYFDNPAATIIRGGIYYGLGCLAATLLVVGTFYVYTVSSILLFMAMLPGMFAIAYWRTPLEIAPEGSHPTLRQAFRDFRSPGAVMFALLLFFQFGNEYSIAGWLPLLLIRRVGLSPTTALSVLSFYWLCLLVGRAVAVYLLPHVRHGKLLLGSVLAALFGCLILAATGNAFGAATGAFFLGVGFASIYPLVAEKIGGRFPYYHPGFFNGIFSFALLGGLLAPATLGYAAECYGVGVVIAIPLLGTIMVLALVLAIWLESKVTGQ